MSATVITIISLAWTLSCVGLGAGAYAFFSYLKRDEAVELVDTIEDKLSEEVNDIELLHSYWEQLMKVEGMYILDQITKSEYDNVIKELEAKIYGDTIQ